MSEYIEPTIEELENPIEEEILDLPQRVNHFCVISKSVIEVEDANGKKHDLHMIETNSSWGRNPYGEDYAVVPDDMVADIVETKGFCDIVLNEDETEVVWFTAREIPEIPTEEEPPSDIDILYEIEADQELRICCLEMGLSADEFA